MIINKKVGIILLGGLLLIVFLINLSNASLSSLTVPAGDEINQKINLDVNDRVVIEFKILGTKNNFVSFSLFYPNATEINFGEIGELNYNFMCDAKGEYQLNFVNNDMNESKLVTLNLDVEHYILGMPQMLFLAVVIVVIFLAGLAARVLSGPM
ncbi:hypothetical protein [Romboutsia sp.]|uniref:hypothetical protein n=1 Tax=Romboutsia sp. TaxID=1965302 RepID=UPI002C921CB0|nr:hypothetical protein [Romboutsia sp.]HSQ90054.1 hypothetical protein [Romboutsia sp.]